MPSPRFEVPVGAVDGVNKVFLVSRPYSPGSTALFINGLLQERTLIDGWVETDADAGQITLKEAPRSVGSGDDIIQVFFIDRSPALPETQLFKLRGVIKMRSGVSGVMRAASGLHGSVLAPKPLTGSAVQRNRFRTSVDSTTKIRSIVKACAK